jgi:malate dehydrogenase (oxaloacetate-decarboxylating)(NADP+)
MKVAAAHALADLAREPVSEVVLKAYDLDHLTFGPDYIIPKPFDPRVLWWVAPAVASTAVEEGLALKPFEDLEHYRNDLQAKFQSTYGLMHTIRVKAKERSMRVVYPQGADPRIIRAARRVRDEGIAAPIILGNVGAVQRTAGELEIPLDDIELLDPIEARDHRVRYSQMLFETRQRKGMTLDDASKAIFEQNLFAAMMLKAEDADAMLGGLTTYYADTLRPALQVLPLEHGRSIVSAHYIVMIDRRPYFFADCAVNISPTAEELAEIALSTAATALHDFDVAPRVAMLSYSNFGSAGGAEPERVREAVRICNEKAPDLPLDGEMHADTAVTAHLLQERHPFNKLGGPANVLVFPDLAAANAAYQLLHHLAGAQVIGPILTGMSKSVHVAQRDAEVGDIVNLTAIAVLDAQRKSRNSTLAAEIERSF